MPCPWAKTKNSQAMFSSADSLSSSPSSSFLLPCAALGHRGIRRFPVIGRSLILLEPRQKAAQRINQLVAGDIALAKLEAQPEGLILRAIVEDEGLRARAGIFLFL